MWSQMMLKKWCRTLLFINVVVLSSIHIVVDPDDFPKTLNKLSYWLIRVFGFNLNNIYYAKRGLTEEISRLYCNEAYDCSSSSLVGFRDKFNKSHNIVEEKINLVLYSLNSLVAFYWRLYYIGFWNILW